MDCGTTPRPVQSFQRSPQTRENIAAQPYGWLLHVSKGSDLIRKDQRRDVDLQDPRWNGPSAPSAGDANERNRMRIRCSLEARDCLGRVCFRSVLFGKTGNRMVSLERLQ